MRRKLIKKRFSLFNIMIVIGLIVGCSTGVQPSSALKDQVYFNNQALVPSNQAYLYLVKAVSSG
ncbi:hypothetical protein [Borrelia persica]|uniref:hypothetical protein n=1 Tax=Borrelia persica TaxID=44448 RepID=UPI0004635B58|nr:hypothetical protein [Borrelia persica]